MAVNDFNFLAPYYDGISRLVFGDKLPRAQTHFLNRIAQEDAVLIIGGGTGRLLEHVPPCKSIGFVEKSAKMIKRASRRGGVQKVEFIEQDFMYFDTSKEYDTIICPFFLDCLAAEELEVVLGKIKSLLNPRGSLVVVDFQQTKSNKFQLTLMHLFFRIFAGLGSKSLLNIHEIVSTHGFNMTEEKFFHRNRLFSRLYRNL